MGHHSTTRIARVRSTFGLLPDADNNGVPVSTQLWDTSVRPVALAAKDGDRIFYGLGPSYIVRSDGSIIGLARDGLGTVRAETSASGNTGKSFRFAAHGGLAQSFGGSPTILGYAGEYGDASGLTYLRSRWYDPQVGRFLTSDALGGSPELPATLNRYAYGEGNPITRTDPTGHCTGGDNVIYCIERWIPMSFACPVATPDLCGTGDDRWWPLPYAGSYRERILIEGDGHISSDAGVSEIYYKGARVPFGGGKGTSQCDGSYGHESIVVNCVAISGVGDFGPGPIRTHVEILFSDGRPVVYASGTFFPSLAVYQYGADGAHLLYFYNGKPAGLEGLDSPNGLLPNMLEGK